MLGSFFGSILPGGGKAIIALLRRSGIRDCCAADGRRSASGRRAARFLACRSSSHCVPGAAAGQGRHGRLAQGRVGLRRRRTSALQRLRAPACGAGCFWPLASSCLPSACDASRRRAAGLGRRAAVPAPSTASADGSMPERLHGRLAHRRRSPCRRRRCSRPSSTRSRLLGGGDQAPGRSARVSGFASSAVDAVGQLLALSQVAATCRAGTASGSR